MRIKLELITRDALLNRSLSLVFPPYSYAPDVPSTLPTKAKAEREGAKDDEEEEKEEPVEGEEVTAEKDTKKGRKKVGKF